MSGPVRQNMFLSVLRAGEILDQLVEEGVTFVEGLDDHALVAAVGADVLDVAEEAADAVQGMPARRRERPSVAPISMTGTTGTPGHMAWVTSLTAWRTSGRCACRSGVGS